jgi:hypothetical protein
MGIFGFVLHKKVKNSYEFFRSSSLVTRPSKKVMRIEYCVLRQMRLTCQRFIIHVQNIHIRFFAQREKRRPSIIRRRYAFDTKNWSVFRDSGHVSRLLERNKKFFRKIEKCRKLLSFCVENREILSVLMS